MPCLLLTQDGDDLLFLEPR